MRPSASRRPFHNWYTRSSRSRGRRACASSTGTARRCRGDPASGCRGNQEPRMKLIGIEEHYLTADGRDAWETIGLAATYPCVPFHSGEVERPLLDLAGERIAL